PHTSPSQQDALQAGRQKCRYRKCQPRRPPSASHWVRGLPQSPSSHRRSDAAASVHPNSAYVVLDLNGSVRFLKDLISIVGLYFPSKPTDRKQKQPLQMTQSKIRFT